MPILRSLTARYLFSHVLVTLLTILLLLALVLISLTDMPPGMLFARYYASSVASDWLIPPGYYEPVNINLPPLLPGFDMVVSPDHEVVYARGENMPCQVGEPLTICAPEYVDRPTGEQVAQANGRDWIDVTLILTTGHRVIARVASQTATDTFSDMIGLIPFIGVVTLASIPAALLLSWLLARGQIRRFRRMIVASQRFADGDFNARINDSRKDVLGKLAQQFDTMAQALESNIGTLRTITQQLMQARQRGEDIAAQNERLRLSRELHDDIAQRLFSLTAASTSLPDLIRRDPLQGAELAQTVAQIAQQTLLDLRGLLTNLRSSELEIYGLYDGLSRLCQTWEETHRIPAQVSIILSGKPLLPSLEETVYRLTQEGLHNIAKHAHARSVQMTLIEGQSQLRFSLSDDGRGFDPSETHPDKLGLMGMRERVRALGGTLNIETGEDGTTLTVTLPLHAEEEI
jgi:signal transduction histidine kinase